MNNPFLKKLQELEPKRGKLTYFSFFCGGGGLDLGFASAGFKPLYSTDLIEHCCSTVESNLPGHIVEATDVNELSGKQIIEKVGERPNFIIGGPPCQSFSILGKRGSTDDPRGQLVFKYAKLINEISPDGFLFENVPGILTLNKGKDWENLVEFFREETGFNISFKVLNSADYGVPQIRRRVILIGTKTGTFSSWPTAEYVSSDDLLSKGMPSYIPSKFAFEEIDNAPNHIKRVHSERVASRYSQIEPGGRCKVDRTDRVDPEKPSGTVLVGSGGGGGRPFIHPYEHRHLTVREACRLQSFPDWWKLEGPGTWQYRQVGNAVPPLMAKAIAQSIKAHLTSETRIAMAV